jgi:hypothetical protein
LPCLTDFHGAMRLNPYVKNVGMPDGISPALIRVNYFLRPGEQINPFDIKAVDPL